MTNKDQWCFAWAASNPNSIGSDRGLLLNDARWNSGDIITVSFLDGDPTLHHRVREVARQWVLPNRANLILDFRKKQNTLIRISFRHPGSWSTIGTTCRRVTDISEPTMNYGWLTPNSSDEDIKRVVLHEFGHALGLIHEHQNPQGTINWDRQAVIDDLSSSPNNWSLEDIEHNVFGPYSKNETSSTQLDPLSIMMYPIPKRWTTDGFSTGLNHDISTKDEQFIRNQYP